MSLSHFFWGFISWIAEESVRQGIGRLYFFTREGEFFKQLYDVWHRYSQLRDKMPAAQVIEVSRMSVFLPSMQEISLAECMRIWNQYSEQSMEALCKSLSIEVNTVKKILCRYGIKKDERIRKPWTDSRVVRLFQDTEFLARLEEKRELSRSLLYMYLEQKGWGRCSTDKVGVVDIGWRGSIQDSLCRLYPDCRVIGFYIGLQPFLNRQPDNAVKFGYIGHYKNKDVILLTVRPLEMLCNSPFGSTQGYRMQDGRVYAVRKQDIYEDRVYKTYAGSMQKKILSDRKACMQVMKLSDRKACTQAMKLRTAGIFPGRKTVRPLYCFLAYPDRRAAAAYFSLNHNEEFGMGKYIQINASFRPGLFGRALFSARYRRQVKEMLKETAWPQGYLAYFRMYPFLFPYNCLLRIYLRHIKSIQRVGINGTDYDGHSPCEK